VQNLVLSRSRQPLILLLCVPLLILTSVTGALAQSSSHSQPSRPSDARRMARAVDLTLSKGIHGQLPPHISTLLGISHEQELPVMQGVVRAGKLVQGFDVSTANKNDVVIFVVDEAAGDQTLYLTSRQGLLRKVVSVKAGVGTVQTINADYKKSFANEKQFWLDRLEPISASAH
jgi:hypothetical protein